MASVKKAIKIGTSYVAEDDTVQVRLNFIKDSSRYLTLSKYLKNDALVGRLHSINNDFDEDTVLQLDISTQYNANIVELPFSYIKSVEVVQCP